MHGQDATAVVQVTLAPAGERLPCLCWWHASCGLPEAETAPPACPAPTALADGAGGTGLNSSTHRSEPTAWCALRVFELPMGKKQYDLGNLGFL